MLQSLTGLLPEEIAALLPETKQKYRGTQIFRWIHERCADSFEEMSNLPKDVRSDMGEKFTVSPLETIETLVSDDLSTEKFLWRLQDGLSIESVIIRDENRTTICISSQVGCKMGCRFCRTGKMGFIRNLSAGEIVGQLLKIRSSLRSRGEDISNIVFMGMGEPLDNLEAVIKAIKIINMETALGIGQRKITVSTCGIAPAMFELNRQFKRIGLAISLNATTEQLRSDLMPINRTYPLADLLDAAHDFSQQTNRRVTFEYILMKGVNDSVKDARALIKIARRIPSKINLIIFNEFEDAPFRKPSETSALAFQKILTDNHVTAFIRKSKGSEILAACGQLASKKQ